MLPRRLDWFHVASHLTSLEITPSGQGASRVSNPAESLNVFLYSEGARKLRHLSVKGIYFLAEHLSQLPQWRRLQMASSSVCMSQSGDAAHAT